jgi:sulfate adenylyltransferase subunit 1 (EFTu-like GTPase family)
MSVREDIAQNITSQLGDIISPAVAVVTRNNVATSSLSIQQFPAIIILSGSETKEDATMVQNRGTTTTGTVFGEIDFTINAFVRSSNSTLTLNDNLDTQRNDLIEAIEEKLAADRTRGGNALNAYITDVAVDAGNLFPLAQAIITYRVEYKYTRGTT